MAKTGVFFQLEDSPLRFEFINSSGIPSKVSHEVRTAVRRQATRPYRFGRSETRREVDVSTPSSSGSASSDAGTPTGGGSFGKFKSAAYKKRKRDPKPKAATNYLPLRMKPINEEDCLVTKPFPDQLLLKSGLIDPFSATSAIFTPAVQKWLHHYLVNVPNTILPFESYAYNLQSMMAPLALKDDALLHAIVVYSMEHKIHMLESTPNKVLLSSKEEVISFRLKAISLINESLSSGHISDSTCGAVLTMVFSSNWNGESLESDAHFNGVERMIMLRGGLEYLPTHIARALSFYALKRSARTLSYPSTPHLKITSKIPDSILSCLNSTRATFPAGQFESFDLQNLLGQTLSAVFQDLFYFTKFVDITAAGRRHFSQVISTIFEDSNHSIEYRLVAYIDPDPLPSTRCNFRTVCRIAAINFFHLGLWHWPKDTALMKDVSQHLVTALRATDLPASRDQYPDLLLWVLVVAGCCLLPDTREYAWIVSEIRELIAVQETFASIWVVEATLMAGFLYRKAIYHNSLEQLWRDIEIERVIIPVTEDVEAVSPQVDCSSPAQRIWPWSGIGTNVEAKPVPVDILDEPARKDIWG